jgi:hypothetical protein
VTDNGHDNASGNGLKTLSAIIVLYVASGAYTTPGETKAGFLLLNLNIARPSVILDAGIFAWAWLWCRYWQHRPIEAWIRIWRQEFDRQINTPEPQGCRNRLSEWIRDQYGPFDDFSISRAEDGDLLFDLRGDHSVSSRKAKLRLTRKDLAFVNHATYLALFVIQPSGWNYWMPHLAAVAATVALGVEWLT